MLTNGTILTISKRDTLRHLGIYSLGPLQIVYVKLNTINGVLVCLFSTSLLYGCGPWLLFYWERVIFTWQKKNCSQVAINNSIFAEAKVFT